ncbi:hypothetical protein JNUCC64_17840 [Streptomyces sp. JNUCC 64]
MSAGLSRIADWAGLLSAGLVILVGTVVYFQGRGWLLLGVGLLALAMNLFTFGPRQRARREARTREEERKRLLREAAEG